MGPGVEESGGGEAKGPAGAKLAPAAVRALESKRLGKLDAATAALEEDQEPDEDVLRGLRQAREACAGRIAATHDLGKRVEAVRQAHAAATANLKAAEQKAREAQEKAAAALEKEHALQAQLETLEQQVREVQPDPEAPNCATAAKLLLDGLAAWLSRDGIPVPDDVREAASHLEGLVVPPAPPAEPSSPTVVGDIPSPTSPADSSMDADSAGGGEPGSTAAPSGSSPVTALAALPAPPGGSGDNSQHKRPRVDA